MSFPIVGAKHRPPAQGILNNLGLDQALWLIPEPDNAFDANAIKVVVNTAEIPQESLDQMAPDLEGYGSDISEIMASPQHHLGYIPARLAQAFKLDGPVEGTLSFDAKGWPQVSVESETSLPRRTAEEAESDA
jgi:hypothetical protein